MMMTNHSHHGRRMSQRMSQTARGFTMVELLVVMGIMAILGVITVIGYRTIARDAKLSSARNAVAAVLDNARGLAMKNNRIVAVVFRPHMDGEREQFVEAVTAQWTGESARVQVGASWQVVDRFAPVPGVPDRRLPDGIKVACPSYATDNDDTWITLSHLPKINQTNGQGEAAGEIIGVMYTADGTTITRNSASDSVRMFVDFDNNGTQDWGAGIVDYAVPIPIGQFNGGLFEQHLADDEPFVEIGACLAVFDDDQVRGQYDNDRWNILVVGGPAAVANHLADYSQYINNNVDPIYFNRYTGVAMSARK